MTRINLHQVIQMVGSDRVVFVDDYTGEELALPLTQVSDIVSGLTEPESHGPADSFGFHAGDNDNPKAPYVDFFWRELPAVKHAIDYFVQCSQLTPEQQRASITVTEARPGESLEDLMKRAGMQHDG